jgi:hypothetical protein
MVLKLLNNPHRTSKLSRVEELTRHSVPYSISKMLKLFYGALHLELLLEVSFKTPFILLKRYKSIF